jgi:hypothetical protein
MGFQNQLITGGHHPVVMLNYQKVDYIQLGFDPSMIGRWLIYFSRLFFCRIWRCTKSALSDVRERFNVIWPHNPHFSIMSTGPLFYHVRLGRLMFYTDFNPSLPLDFQPGGIVARSLLDVTLPSLCLAFHGLLGQPVALDPEVASTLAEVGVGDGSIIES